MNLLIRGPCVKPMLRKETGVGHSSLFFLVVARRLLLLVPSLALCSVPSLHESRVYGTENARDVSYVLHDYRSEACPSITKPLGVNLLTVDRERLVDPQVNAFFFLLFFLSFFKMDETDSQE